MPGTRTVSRCAQCGAVIPISAEASAHCAQCGAALHSCKQCVHFDPASHFECQQAIAQRIPQKDAANDCTFYSLRVRVERETTSAKDKAEDARRAFERLFKK